MAEWTGWGGRIRRVEEPLCDWREDAGLVIASAGTVVDPPVNGVPSELPSGVQTDVCEENV